MTSLVDPIHVKLRPNVARSETPAGVRYLVKWRVGQADRTRSFTTKVKANDFHASLTAATAGRHREMWDGESGLPESFLLEKQSGRSVLELAQAVAASHWKEWSPGQRRSFTEGASAIVVAFVDDKANPPALAVLRRVARDYLLPPPGSRVAYRDERIDGNEVSILAQQQAESWLVRNSQRASSLEHAPTVRGAVASAGVKLNGKPFGRETAQRQRAALSHVIHQALEEELISSNVLGRVKSRTIATTAAVDPGDVPSPVEARTLIDGLSLVSDNAVRQYRAYLTVLWTTGMRPSEAAGLRFNSDLELPEEGWGSVTVRTPLVSTGSRWTDSGEPQEERKSLKGRPVRSARDVLLAPECVRELRAHLELHKVQDGQLLFTNTEGRPIDPSAMSEVWRKVRGRVLEGEFTHLRPYDLRHTAATMMIGAGIPIPRIARQLGHSPQVLMRTYARVMSTDDDVFKSKLDRVLG